MPRRLQSFLRSFADKSSRSQKAPSSFDNQLFIVFFVGMMPQMLLPINGIARCALAAVWIAILVRFAIQHRQRHQWQWPGITTPALLKSVGTFIFGLWCIIPFIVSAANGFLLDKDWIPSHPLGAFSEIAHLFPELMMSKHPIIIFCLIPCIWLIFSIMAELKIAYLSEEEFLKDCRKRDFPVSHKKMETDKSIKESKSRSFFGSIINLFKNRPFILKKEFDAVRIDFYLISTQDLQANPGLIALTAVFFFFSLFGLVQILVFGLSEYLRNIESSEHIPAVLIAWIIQVLIFSLIPYFIWKSFMHTLFVRRIIDFNAKELIVGESLFGRYRRVFSIGRADLLPLEQRQKQITVPRVSNAALIIQRRGKDMELAGHLLPEAMTAVQDVYDRYRTSTFSRFYSETRPLYLR